MVDSVPNSDPPLVDVKVTNPVTYIKNWWNKIIGNEGVEFRLHIRPLTAIITAAVIATIGFGVGRFVLPPGIKIPFFEFGETTTTPTPTPDLWRDTAYTGTLHFMTSTGKYYLQVTSSSEAITLDVPPTLNLENLIGRRIFASGKYNKTTRILVVAEAKDMEILPKSPVPIPTLSSTPTPSPTPEITPSPTETSSPLPSML